MRGKNVLKSVLLLSMMMLSSVAFAFPPAFAPVTPTVLSLPVIVDPLKTPGSSLTVYITIANVKRLATFDFNVGYNPAVLQAVSYSVFGGSPVYMMVDPLKSSGIDNTVGKVWFSGVKAWPPQTAPYFFMYYDADHDGQWDVGEKGVQDTNRNGLYSAYDGDLRFMRRTFPYGNSVPELSPLTAPGPLDKYYDTQFDGIWTREDSLMLLPEPVVRDVNNNNVYDPGTDVVLYTDALTAGTGAPGGNPPAGGFLNYFTGPVTTENALPLAAITFNVMSRGFSTLDLFSCVLKDNFGNTILPLQQKDGSFDNRFQGKLIAPFYMDADLDVGDIFSIDISVDDCKKLWGYQFTLYYDPTVLTPLNHWDPVRMIYVPEWDNLGVFNMSEPSEVNLEEGWLTVAAHSYFGDPTGLTTTTPVPVAKLWFRLNNEGWSTLKLGTVSLANVKGETQIFEIFDGSFTSLESPVAQLAGQHLRVEHRVFKQSSELALGEDLINDMKTPIQYQPSAEGQPVTFLIVFSVSDLGSGMFLGTIVSDTYTVSPHTTINVITGFNTAQARWGTPTYRVSIDAILYYDGNGDGVMESLGGSIGSFDFTVQP